MQRARRGHRDATGPLARGLGQCLRGVPQGAWHRWQISQPARNRAQPTNTMPYTYRGTHAAALWPKRPPTGPEFMPISHAILRGETDVSDEVRDAISVLLWSLRSDRVSVNLWDRIGALPIEVRVEVAGLLVIEDGRREHMLEQLLAEEVAALPVRNAEQDVRSLPEWACADLGPLLPGMALAGEAGDGRLGDNWLGDPEGLQDPIKL